MRHDELRILAAREGETVEGGKRFALLDDDINCGMSFDQFEDLLDFLRKDAVNRGYLNQRS